MGANAMLVSGVFGRPLERVVDHGVSSEWSALFAAGDEVASLMTNFGECTSSDMLREAMLDLARRLGFRGARYVHLGHRALGLTFPEQPPVRFLSTFGEQADPWRPGDPVAPRIKESFLAFAWSSRDDTALPDIQRAWLSIERKREIEAGVTIPVQDYVCGPAYLTVLGQAETIAQSRAEQRAQGLGYAGLRMHLGAKQVLQVQGPPLPELTDREMICLRHAASGATLPMSAESLGIAKRTVEYHLGRAVEKLEAKNKIHAVAIAMSTGLIQI
jgi:LuxR family transcriptional regulator, activator of conjugal transfer of Ti plasmids